MSDIIVNTTYHLLEYIHTLENLPKYSVTSLAELQEIEASNCTDSSWKYIVYKGLKHFLMVYAYMLQLWKELKVALYKHKVSMAWFPSSSLY